ncbi:unnamed protein product, partial [Arabidopsis halleri]
ERKDLQVNRNQRDRRESSGNRRRYGSPMGRASATPAKRRSPPRAQRYQERNYGYSPRRREEVQRRSEFKRAHRHLSEEVSHRYPRSHHPERISESRHQRSVWRSRRSPPKTRSVQDTTSGAGREFHNSQKEPTPSRQEILNTPPPRVLPASNPPGLSGRLGIQSSTKDRRPILERLSGGEAFIEQSQGFGVSSSMSGRLQDVNIQYLGEEGQTGLPINNDFLVGSSSAQLHPTLGHRLSLGHEDSQGSQRVPANQRLSLEQPAVTISIPDKIPKTRANAKKKASVPASSRGTRSPLQGASSKKRNATKPRVVAARKRLCHDQVPTEVDTVTEPQPSQPSSFKRPWKLSSLLPH